MRMGQGSRPRSPAGAHPRLPPRSYGTHCLLEACRVYGRVRRFICVSTDEVYGDTSLGAAAGGACHVALPTAAPSAAALAAGARA